MLIKRIMEKILVCDNCFRPPPKDSVKTLLEKPCGHLVCSACSSLLEGMPRVRDAF